MSDKLEFTAVTFKAFKAEYSKAVEAGNTSFMFQGKEVLVAYAKYLIEYLSTRF